VAGCAGDSLLLQRLLLPAQDHAYRPDGNSPRPAVERALKQWWIESGIKGITHPLTLGKRAPSECPHISQNDFAGQERIGDMRSFLGTFNMAYHSHKHEHTAPNAGPSVAPPAGDAVVGSGIHRLGTARKIRTFPADYII